MPIKLFFDIDGSDIPTNFFNTVERLLQQHYPNTVKPVPHLVLSACSSSYKSYHIIYPTILFLNMIHLQSFILRVLSSALPSIDSKVYTRYRQMRPYLSSKYGQNRPLIQFQNSINPNNSSLSDEVAFLLSLISYLQGYNRNSLLSFTSDICVPPEQCCMLPKVNPGASIISPPRQIPSHYLSFIKDSLSSIEHCLICPPAAFLKHSHANLVSYHLKNFPCPYHFPSIHIHRRNRPYILFSLDCPPSLNNVVIRCHKERNDEGVNLQKYLLGMFTIKSICLNMIA